jgi:RNA polymerase sigma-70 factor (ECF subfamily)
MATEREYFIETILPLKHKLFRKAFFLTKSLVESEDIVQDVMITLWDKRATWENIKNVEVYAMVLTKNRALDRVKRKSGRNQSIDAAAESKSTSIDTNPLETMILNDERKLVWYIIEQLPEYQRELIILRELEGHSYQGMARILQTTEAQVKINLYRARQKVKELYIKIAGNGC